MEGRREERKVREGGRKTGKKNLYMWILNYQNRYPQHIILLGQKVILPPPLWSILIFFHLTYHALSTIRKECVKFRLGH